MYHSNRLRKNVVRCADRSNEVEELISWSGLVGFVLLIGLIGYGMYRIGSSSLARQFYGG